STTNGGLRLYAVWVPSQGSLQNSTKVAELCGTGDNALTTAPTDGTAGLSSVSALTDQRDNETYAIAKLADGNCWMIENLRLEAEYTRGEANEALAQGYGTSATYGNFIGLADAESANFGTTIANSIYYTGNQSGTASIDIGTSDNPYTRMPRYNNINTSSRALNPTLNNEALYSYGNYYTWHAAIANLEFIRYNNNSTANTSLCPSSWRLPHGDNKARIESNDDNDYWNLVVDALNNETKPANYDSQIRPYYTGTEEAGPVIGKLKAFPNNFLYSGEYGGSSKHRRGDVGTYWTSNAQSDNVGASYVFHLANTQTVVPGSYGVMKNTVVTIRCMVSSST
ncbi:hypothetical protein IKF30_01040, partial [Candidatus Saccharibacteria bacterium]|nr:hypothetical protein [Candidatus Saccharibacteria bacterium]